MLTTSTVAEAAPNRTHSRGRFVHVSPARREDQTLRAASCAYQLAQDLSEMADEVIARTFSEDRTTFNRHRNGQTRSAKSKARREILRLGDAGGDPWPLVADDIAAAVQVTVAPRLTADLLEARDAVYRMEQESNGQFDTIQFRRMQHLELCEDEVRRAKLYQAACTLAALAIHDELCVRGAA